VAAVVLLYGIGSLNAANLMLLRMLGRRREFSVRLALGAGAGRLARLIIIEALLISSAACVGGATIAKVSIPLLAKSLETTGDAPSGAWTLDGRALCVLLLLTVVTTAFIAAVVIVRLRFINVLEGLKEGAMALGETASTGRMRNLFALLQVALSVVLLVGATLMSRTLAKLAAVELGFDEEHVIKIELAIPNDFMSGTERRLLFLNQLREELLHVPGTSEVAYTSNSLLRGQYSPSLLLASDDGGTARGELAFVSSTFLEATGIRLLRGRKNAAVGGEVLVNESFARALFGEKDPIDQALRILEGGDGKYPWRISGVVSDVREAVRSPPGNLIYGPESWYVPGLTTLLVRTSRPADSAAAIALRRAIFAFAPRIVVTSAEPATVVRSGQSTSEHLVTATLQLLSALALLLAVIGVFSVLSFTVSQRRGEFGIRMALGATSRGVVRLVLARGLILVGAGLAVGLIVTLVLNQALVKLLYGVAPTDPASLVIVALIMLAAAALAASVPAWRASRVNPAKLLQVQ
jgi:putative ABC transport system permease protein